MADEEIAVASSPEPSDHKRKFDDLEPHLHNSQLSTVDINELMNKKEDEAVNGGDSDESDTKRPRLDDKPDAIANENGYTEDKVEEEKLDGLNAEVTEKQPADENIEADEDTQKQQVENVPETEKDEESVHVSDHAVQLSDENPKLENNEEPSKEDFKETEKEILEVTRETVYQQGDDASYAEQQPGSEPETTSRKIEVPNAKVGVLIGKGGDTIRNLQLHSGARIQITRDAEADPHAPTRPVELLGTLEHINKAERLIKDVIAEADAGGSPALVARGFNNVQSSGAAEQIEIQVPNQKVGLIIGKGGDTIKNLQTRSGARIQLIPQRSSEGEQSRERTVRLTGEKNQIEMAREMIKEVMNQQVRPSANSSGYNQQQGSRPHGHDGSQWGPQGPSPSHPTGYDYPPRGPPYSSHNPPPAYGTFPPQLMDPRTNFNRDQRPPSAMQGPPQGGGGYNYYGGQGGGPTPPSNTVYNHGPGPTTAGPPQVNYNYGQPPPYSQTAPQGYGHPPQQSAYPQAGYGPPNTQSYGPPRANQPGDLPYKGPPTQSYGPNVPTQQPFLYPSTGPAQQTYPPYGSAPVPATASGPGYQTGQPGYSQQAPVYPQPGPTGYAQYPSAQPGYTELPAPTNYGYQVPPDPAYGAGQGYSAQPTGQSAYSQPAPVQTGYDQSGGYGTVQGAVPVKSISPQPGYPQYDVSQMYGAPR